MEARLVLPAFLACCDPIERNRGNGFQQQLGGLAASRPLLCFGGKGWVAAATVPPQPMLTVFRVEVAVLFSPPLVARARGRAAMSGLPLRACGKVAGPPAAGSSRNIVDLYNSKACVSVRQGAQPALLSGVLRLGSQQTNNWLQLHVCYSSTIAALSALTTVLPASAAFAGARWPQHTYACTHSLPSVTFEG